ncbi:EamA family transporter [Candidatus Azambacteria bacterium]|nr:EamA family transporter [Candidatus Azambacteria bacterium]
MSWFFISIISYFITAINSIVDKFLLGKSIPNPILYSFYVGIFSIFTIILIPFGMEWPGMWQFLIALSVGALYLAALIAFFTALIADEASRIVSLVGAITPVFILIFSDIFFGSELGRNQMIAFVLLVLGGALISLRKDAKCRLLDFGMYSCARNTWIAILASLFFAAFFLLAKYVFSHQDFISGFVYTRLGSLVAAILLLAFPLYRKMISQTTQKVHTESLWVFIFNKTFAGVAFLLLNYAISLGNVALINALEGVKYIFVLIIIFLFSKKLPGIIREDTSWLIMLQKTLAVFLIFIGLYMLAGFK